MTKTVATIVEGAGEVQALPLLVRRICHELLGVFDVSIRKPWRLPRGKLVKPDELAKVVNVVSHSVGSVGGIIVLFDQDDDPCVVDLARATMVESPTGAMVEIVVAAREYEAWLLSAVSSLQGHSSVKPDAEFTGCAELPRDAKGRLEAVMHERYRETLHQPAFTERFDLRQAMDGCRSFRRLVSAVQRLTTDVKHDPGMG